MRHVAVLALLVASCTSSNATTTTIDPLPPPPNPESPSTPATVPPLTIPPASTPPIQGFFPDGTDHILKLRAYEPEEATAIAATILYEEEGAVWTVGETLFLRGQADDEHSFVDGVFLLQAAPSWYLRIEVDPEVLEHLGPDAERILLTHIGADASRDGFPIIELTRPFRWSTPHDPTGPMSVTYETFAVSLGCDEDAISCHANGTMQVKALPGVDPPELTIESFIGRPISDSFYLDPGPLTERSFSDVLWTGDEMIVWGGFRNDVAWHTDGAAYNPQTDEWWMLAEPPIPRNTRSFAVWAGDEMVAISREGTFGYDPVSNSWREIADRIAVPHHDPVGIAIDGTVYAWAMPFVMELDRDVGQWKPLPDPLPRGEIWYRSMRDFDGRLLLTTADNEVCGGRRFLVWNGAKWDELPEVSSRTRDYADCSDVKQVAVVEGRIVAWGYPDAIARVFDENSGEWAEVGHTGLSGIEGPSGPVVMGDRLLVPEWIRGVLFYPPTEPWSEVDLPGQADASYMVWNRKRDSRLGRFLG